MGKKYTVHVAGDSTTDLFTHYIKGKVASDQDHPVQHVETAFDLDVPAGAYYTQIVLDHLLGRCSGPKVRGRVARLHLGQVYTLPKSLTVLREYPWEHGPKGRSFRIDQFSLIEKYDNPKNEAAKKSKSKDLPPGDFLVIHDSGPVWKPRAGAGHGKPADKLSSHLAKMFKTSRPYPRIFVNLSNRLPQLESSADKRDSTSPFIHPAWNVLKDPKYIDSVAVFLSANPLRHQGAAISRRLSWEQSVEDLAADLHLMPELRTLGQFPHLFIRFGMIGVLHIQTSREGDRTARLYFLPTARDGVFREPRADGRVTGKNTLLIASLIHQFHALKTKKGISEAIDEGVTRGMRAFLNAFNVGYDPTLLDKKKVSTSKGLRGEAFVRQYVTPISRIILEGKDKLASPPASRTKSPDAEQEGRAQWVPSPNWIGCVPVPRHLFVPPRPGKSLWPEHWEILSEELGRSRCERINLGVAIVVCGHDRVLNRTWKNVPEVAQRLLGRAPFRITPEEPADYATLPHGQLPLLPLHPMPGCSCARHYETDPNHKEREKTLVVPVLRFGRLTAIERDELESFWSMRNLVRAYVENGSRRKKPISIAAFGPPGSGKSFAIKQIAESVDAANKGIELIEYNVAQFREPADLGHALTRVSSANNMGKLPLVFFDEFDCWFNDKPLGWLKYFLAPMQDGTYYGANETVSIGRAIFVFAGGIYGSFDEFDPFSQPPGAARNQEVSAELRQRQQEFRDQKGPDFISRLRGHVDILSINAEPGDVKHIIRRSIQLRSMVEELELTMRDGDYDRAMIDPDVIYALLTMDRYRHGTRSMEAILQMCGRTNGRIEKASLPPRVQLNMHVDADEFYIRMYRGRAWSAEDVDSAVPGIARRNRHTVPRIADASKTAIEPQPANEHVESPSPEAPPPDIGFPITEPIKKLIRRIENCRVLVTKIDSKSDRARHRNAFNALIKGAGIDVRAIASIEQITKQVQKLQADSSQGKDGIRDLNAALARLTRQITPR